MYTYDTLSEALNDLRKEALRMILTSLIHK